MWQVLPVTATGPRGTLQDTEPPRDSKRKPELGKMNSPRKEAWETLHK